MRIYIVNTPLGPLHNVNGANAISAKATAGHELYRSRCTDLHLQVSARRKTNQSTHMKSRAHAPAVAFLHAHALIGDRLHEHPWERQTAGNPGSGTSETEHRRGALHPLGTPTWLYLCGSSG